MAITVVVGIRKVCLSKRRKGEQVSFRSGIQTPASFNHLAAKNPNQAPIYQSVQSLPNTASWLQKFIIIKPYVETGRMSNQKKSEFVNGIFHIQSFWGCHGQISPKI
jgi:hypothetical protein